MVGVKYHLTRVLKCCEVYSCSGHISRTAKFYTPTKPLVHIYMVSLLRKPAFQCCLYCQISEGRSPESDSRPVRRRHRIPRLRPRRTALLDNDAAAAVPPKKSPPSPRLGFDQKQHDGIAAQTTNGEARSKRRGRRHTPDY